MSPPRDLRTYRSRRFRAPDTGRPCAEQLDVAAPAQAQPLEFFLDLPKIALPEGARPWAPAVHVLARERRRQPPPAGRTMPEPENQSSGESAGKQPSTAQPGEQPATEPTSPSEAASGRQTLSFQAEVRDLLKLMIHSLYSHREIFLRELISNASDANDRLRFAAIATPALLAEDPELEIRVDADPAKGTLTISDNGIGMTREEAVSNLGTIARSGTAEVL